MKEILESKAIKHLGTLSGPKEYRYWNQRLKNAMDQARPSYGREIVTILEDITESMVENQKELASNEDVTECIFELIAEKEEDASSTKTD